jgi:starch-binding outer membrane protein, SusD/RagB family
MRYKKNIKGYIRSILFISLILSTIVQTTSCKKYLDKKPRQDLAIPSSLSDLQAILDNQKGNSGSLSYPEFVADNFYWSSSTWNGAQVQERTNYIWDRNEITSDDTWTPPYYSIYNFNFILDYLPKIAFNESERSNYNNIKGAALFYRAFIFHQLAQLFCKPFSNSASGDPGIVLRLTAAVEAPSIRATVQETYDQIVGDLKTAAELLPITTLFSTRPNKAAAYAALARVYLSMRDYANAELYANSCLALNNVLLDYNSLAPAANPVLPGFINNPEILFSSYGRPVDRLEPPYCNIDSNLYQSYNVNDLRKTVFFGPNGGGTFYWKGNYLPDLVGINYNVFGGIATDEVYLILAECRARAGNKDGAMADLNTLLRKRWKTGTFADLTATNTADALNKVLSERRKELLFRGLRWSDLRRFNLEGANITLTRIVNGTTYTLPPNDLRWVLLIPDLEISRSGIPQNPR